MSFHTVYSKDRRKGDGGGDRRDRGKRREKRTQGREVTGQREKDARGKSVLDNVPFQRMEKIWVLTNAREANERVATTSYLV